MLQGLQVLSINKFLHWLSFTIGTAVNRFWPHACFSYRQEPTSKGTQKEYSRQNGLFLSSDVPDFLPGWPTFLATHPSDNFSQKPPLIEGWARYSLTSHSTDRTTVSPPVCVVRETEGMVLFSTVSLAPGTKQPLKK